MASLGAKPEELPEDFKIFVQAEFLVASEHRDLFAHSLGNDLAVERVRVVWREIKKIERMMRCVGQYAKVQILAPSGCRLRRSTKDQPPFPPSAGTL